MTHPNLKSGLPVPMARVLDQAYFRSSPSTAPVTPRTNTLPRTVDRRLAANDDAPRKWYEIRNPLWVIVIGMAILFGAMALIVALG
jgi:hypothetical protein